MDPKPIRSMVAGLVDAGVLAPHDAQAAIETLLNHWKNKIAVVWTTDDVIAEGRSLGVALSEEDAQHILRELLTEHHPAIGITCFTIGNKIVEYGVHQSEH